MDRTNNLDAATDQEAMATVFAKRKRLSSEGTESLPTSTSFISGEDYDGINVLTKKMRKEEEDLEKVTPVFQAGPSTSFISEENYDGINVLTKKMLKEEENMAKVTMEEENKLQKRILQEKIKRANEEHCYNSLKLLLSRSSLYANFIADKLKTEEDARNNEEKSSARGKKPKTTSSGSNSKVNAIDVYKKRNMKDIVCEETASGKHNASVKTIEQPRLLNGTTLRSYQLEGFDWLKTIYENGCSGILADEMGLGKTIQSIALIAYLIEMGMPGPFFVCGPLSTIANWHSEFRKFTPNIPVLLYHGDKNERAELRKSILTRVKIGNFYIQPVVITSYQVTMNDITYLCTYDWKLLVVDEAHRLKNFRCKLVTSMKQFNSVNKILLTGTPLQNDLSELWSLLNFILPEIFDNLKVFESWFNIDHFSRPDAAMEIVEREEKKDIINSIHQILTPFLLRRTKCEVELQLPTKKEILVNAPMSHLQKQYYQAVLNKSIEDMLGCSKENTRTSSNNAGRSKRKIKRTSFFGVELSLDQNESIPHPSSDFNINEMAAETKLNIRNLQMLLRKICCHPYLISYPLNEQQEYKIDENIVSSSGKMAVMDLMLGKLKERGHKVLIFSQFLTMLDILEDYCNFRSFKWCRLDGTMDILTRQKQIDEFQNDKSCFIFLLSTRAGGLGINLTAADTVLIYDSDWNPQVDLQAQDRCHRIGQKNAVLVYRLVIPNSMDERVITFASAKRKLEKVIIQKGRFSSHELMHQTQKKITKDELLELLKSSDFTTLIDANKNVISDSELEKILDRKDLVEV